ncbi:twin-arginine translocation signal domain-containing protein [Salinibaculum rarum]|uniref:twin-arginine translocation signal domain-containing protein n=1 Tax=Salinibaculum rarum TaxID=3058903 RepID=UPI00265EBBA9|nr:twin-arginine translocation signal domain-containing protein [Salinibaculum sp. KK48]
MKPTRRQFLATSAAAGAGMLAGCEQIPFLGGGGGSGAFANWVPAAGELEPDSEAVRFRVSSPTQIHGNRNNLRPNTYAQRQRSYRTGVSWQSLNMELSFESGTVYKGSYNVGDVDSELTTPSGAGDGGEYSQEDSKGNYDIYIPDGDDTDDARQAWAVSGNAIISAQATGSRFGNTFSSAVENAKTIIDVGQNGEGRAVNDDDAFSTLANELGGTIVYGRTLRDEISSSRESIARGDFGGMVASGTSITINGKNSKFKRVFVFDNESEVNTGDLEEYVERNDTSGGILSYARNTSVSQSGSAGVVSATIDTYDIGR